MKTNQRGFIVPLLLIIVALFLAGGGAYYYTQTKSGNPSVAGDVTLPQATSTAPTTNQTAPIAQTSNSQTAGLKTYRDETYGFEFKYSQNLDFQSIAGTNVIQAEVKSGLPSEPHINSVRISISIDRTKTNEKSCMPDVYPTQPGAAQNIAGHVDAGDNVFFEYYSPNYVGCAGFQCDGGRLYTHWFNNTCYQLEYSYSSDYLEKIFSCSSPESSGISKSCDNEADYLKYIVAKQSQDTALKYIDSLANQIISSFKVNQ